MVNHDLNFFQVFMETKESLKDKDKGVFWLIPIPVSYGDFSLPAILQNLLLLFSGHENR